MSESSFSLPATSLFVTGPTAGGKSDVAMALAQRLPGEIISVDSMQVYRGLDLGTAKPSAADRSAVPHHLIDVADLSESFDAARYVAMARDAAAAVASRGKTPIFCGGTGLYCKALTAGLGQAPPSDPKLREALERLPVETLLRELEATDPLTFSRIDPRNPRRVVRAVEVLRLTGRPFSDQRSDWSAWAAAPSPWVGLRRAPQDLKRRIETRVDLMFERGLIEETRELLAQGLESNRAAMQAIGYRQVAEHLRGVRTREQTIELVKARTRQFARRQATWFRHQLRVAWLDVAPDEPPKTTAERLLARHRGGG